MKSIIQYLQISFNIKQAKNYLRFLCIAGFTKDFSIIVTPLTHLLRKSNYAWSLTCQDAFEKVKSVLLSMPVLSAQNFQKQFLLMVDASGVGVGTVLMQCDSDRIEHPVCYFFCKFNSSQRKYSITEKETLVLVLALHNRTF